MPQPLNPISLQKRGYTSQDYQVVLPAGVTIEDALKPEYWAKVCARPDQHGRVFLRRFDRIQLIPEDETCFADVIVLSAGAGWAKVKMVQHVTFDEVEAPAELHAVDVIWRGPSSMWCVERKSDKFRVRDKIQSKREAELAAQDYELVTSKAA